MSIHSIAIHHRATSARVAASKAAVELQHALLEDLATSCCPGSAPVIAAAVNHLKQYNPTCPLCVNLRDLEKTFAGYDGVSSPRKEVSHFLQAHDAAFDLTVAAQTIEYNAALV